jgi:hypothetical protein
MRGLVAQTAQWLRVWIAALRSLGDDLDGGVHIKHNENAVTVPQSLICEGQCLIGTSRERHFR